MLIGIAYIKKDNFNLTKIKQVQNLLPTIVKCITLPLVTYLDTKEPVTKFQGGPLLIVWAFIHPYICFIKLPRFYHLIRFPFLNTICILMTLSWYTLTVVKLWKLCFTAIKPSFLTLNTRTTTVSDNVISFQKKLQVRL